MFGLFVALNFLYKFSLLGRASRTVQSWLGALDDLVDQEKLKRLKEDQFLDLNREKERWEVGQFHIEVLLPYHIRPADLPHIDSLNWVVGDYVFKTREWMSVWMWIGVKAQNVGSSEKILSPVDGPWLLEIGRRRWDHTETRKEAELNEVKLRAEQTPT
jgi:hypothetical protein